MILRLNLVLLAFALCGPVLAQETEAPKDARELAAIKEIREGSWKLVKVEQLIRRFISRGKRHAARCWIAYAVRASERGLLPPETPKQLRILAKTQGLKPSEPQLRAMPSRALKYLKKLQSLKCYGAMPQAIHFTRRCLELYPDKKMAKKVDEIEKSLEKVNRKEQKPLTKGLKKNATRLKDALGKARDELLQDMVDQYRRYPCPPGARAIKALILARGEEEVSAAWREKWDEVCAIEQKVEPKLKVRVWLENGGKVSAYRNGSRLLGTHGRSYFGGKKQGVTFEVVAGDILIFEVKKLHAKKGDRKLFVVGAAAELEGKALPATAWTQNASHRPLSLDPLPNPMCRGILFGPGNMPQDVDPEVLEQAEGLGEGMLIPTANEFHHYTIGMHDKIKTTMAAFAGWKKAPTWIAAECERLSVILRIPHE